MPYLNRSMLGWTLGLRKLVHPAVGAEGDSTARASGGGGV